MLPKTEIREDPESKVHELDRFMTYRDAARSTGIGYVKIQRAAKAGILPTYSLLNARKYVTLRDILRLMSTKN